MSTPLNARNHDLSHLGLISEGSIAHWEVNLNFLQSAYRDGSYLHLHFVSGQVLKYRAETDQLAMDALERIWLLAGSC